MPTKQWSQQNVNPVIGCYGPNGKPCPYCYARRTVRWFNKFTRKCKLCDEFIPHPHLEQLEKITPKQKSRIVFVDGVFDWNGDGVRQEWLEPIVEKMQECSQHTFPILSKLPERYDQYGFTYPENVILGATVTCEKGSDDYKRIAALRKYKGNRKFISFEPLLGPLSKRASLDGMNWVIIGALSKGRKHIQPEKEWVNNIVTRSKEADAVIFVKGTVKGLLLHKPSQGKVHTGTFTKHSCNIGLCTGIFDGLVCDSRSVPTQAFAPRQGVEICVLSLTEPTVLS